MYISEEEDEEHSPIMESSVRVRSNGSTENGTIRFDEVDETKRWFNRRFFCLFAIGISVVILAMAIILVVVILLTQLQQVNANASNVIAESRKQIDELGRALKDPLDQLKPTLDQIKNMQNGGFPQTPPPSPPPGVNPINPIVVGPNTTPEPPRRAPSPRYEWKGCNNLGKCELKGYESPPLVILSLDGFAREYLDRNVIQTLNHIADCGAKGERVYPSFPSKTFPNHYSIVTGLFPESHGITDNSVFDSTLSSTMESMKSTKNAQFFKGEPIWSVYRRKTGKKANCLFWVGCVYNSTGYPPNVALPYDQDLPFRNRIEKVIEWLLSPANERPGLITAYLHEPDNAGHYQVSSEDVDQKLAEIDDGLDYMMSRLSEEKLLECINFAVLSDHGMQVIDKTFYFKDYVSDFNGLIGAKGVVGRIYVNSGNRTGEGLADEMRCKIPNVKVNTRKDIPVRKHYSRSNRVGDVILEGPAGTTFYTNAEDDYHLSGDHGYDYFNDKMHTIFFMRGPSIKPNVTVAPFQNVQYMNLWMALLGIDGSIETNGTLGFFDDILQKPVRREMMTNMILECPAIGLPAARKCSADVASPDKLATISNKLLTCAFTQTYLPLFSDDYCFENYCENIIIRSRNLNDKSIAIVEALSRDEPVTLSSISFVNSKYQNGCPNMLDNMKSIAIRPDNEMNNIADTFLSFPELFTSKILEPLQSKTLEYLNKFGKLYSISGAAMDSNYDGVADRNGSQPTHIYRILITCTSTWLSMNPPLCTNPAEIKTLAFIFPIVEKSAIDCMTTDQILLDYTATLFDVEQISGFKFQIGALTHRDNVVLRRKISNQLW